MNDYNLMPTSDDDNTCATCLYRYEHCQCMAVADAGPELWPQHLVDEYLTDSQIYIYLEPLFDGKATKAILSDGPSFIDIPDELVIVRRDTIHVTVIGNRIIGIVNDNREVL